MNSDTAKTAGACLSLLIILTGCEGFFGKKTPTDFLDEPVYDSRTVAYVPIQPVWDNFTYPTDIIAGWDELLYVVDQGTEEIVALDQAGEELGRFRVQGLTAITQDRRLDILATGTIDTTISGTDFTLPAIYRINLNKTGEYGLKNAYISKKIIHPFYYRSGTPTISDEAVSFTGIAVQGNNKYYVARNGPSNAPSQFGGPDNTILVFDDTDKFQTPVFVTTNLGLIRDYFKSPQGLTTAAQPPQSPAVSSSPDFIFASIGTTNVLRVQYIAAIETPFGISYQVQNFPTGDTSRADHFLYEANRFESPSDVTLTGDGTNYLFVVDAAKDSVFQFNGLGYEGVNPPAGSNSRKVIQASFGGTGAGLTQFREPQGVAYINRILYVADAGNSRVLRFKLTTDFE
ncbi:MAG: hypothetical protein SF052_20865 [Bacteroidia bacterium]|nr:hypothetical protein [Bacteroidia bacterium]